jgi:hypothetical protein
MRTLSQAASLGINLESRNFQTVYASEITELLNHYTLAPKRATSMGIGQKVTTKVTVDLGDPALYRDIRIAAIELDRSVRDIMVQALREWLERQDAIEDQYDLAEAQRILNDPDEERIPLDEMMAEFS